MKVVKMIDEETLEMKDITVMEDENTKSIDDFISMFGQALDGSSEEFAKKYRAYKQAEEEFNKMYEPFKANIIKLHEMHANLPKTVIVGGVKLTYVSPSVRTTIDSKKLKEEEPEIAKKFSKETKVNATIRLSGASIDANSK